MAQIAEYIFGEDVAWMLLQVAGIAIFCFAVREFVVKYQLLPSWLGRPSLKQTVRIREPILTVFCLLSTEL